MRIGVLYDSLTDNKRRRNPWNRKKKRYKLR